MEMFQHIPACMLMVNLNKSESRRETAESLESELIREIAAIWSCSRIVVCREEAE